MQNVNLTEKSRTLYKIKNLFSYIKMGKKILTLGDIEVVENKFYHYKILHRLRVVDIEKVLVSHKTSFGEKAINTLLVNCIMIMKLSHYM